MHHIERNVLFAGQNELILLEKLAFVLVPPMHLDMAIPSPRCLLLQKLSQWCCNVGIYRNGPQECFQFLCVLVGDFTFKITSTFGWIGLIPFPEMRYRTNSIPYTPSLHFLSFSGSLSFVNL